MTSATLISSDHLESIAFRNRLPIEADDRFEYVTHMGITFRALLGGVR